MKNIFFGIFYDITIFNINMLKMLIEQDKDNYLLLVYLMNITRTFVYRTLKDIYRENYIRNARDAV